MASIQYKKISLEDHLYLIDNSGNYRVVEYYENGNLKYEQYYVNRRCHREGDKPAFVGYYESGNIKEEQYLVNDEMHREDGPASIEFFKSGIISKKYYYLFDQEFFEEEYCSEKISLIREVLSVVKEYNLRRKLFQDMYEDC